MAAQMSNIDYGVCRREAREGLYHQCLCPVWNPKSILACYFHPNLDLLLNLTKYFSSLILNKNFCYLNLTKVRPKIYLKFLNIICLSSQKIKSSKLHSHTRDTNLEPHMKVFCKIDPAKAFPAENSSYNHPSGHIR